MNGFTFYKSFYDTIKKIRKGSDRVATAWAVIEYMFDDIEPSTLSEVGEIAFESFRRTLDRSKSNGECNRSKASRNEVETKSNENRNQVENKTICNRNEIKTETRSSSRLRSSSYTPLFIPPQGEKQNDFETVFFEKYPKYAKSKGKTEGIDFEKLLAEFEKSEYLRSLYTFKQVEEIYPVIIRGGYRDKPTAIDDVNARVDRERWYSQRREQAIREAEKINETFLKDETFKRVTKRLNAMIPEMARAEISNKAKYEQLMREEERLKGQRIAILAANGMTEEDLLPKWHCGKCEDTGYLKDGKACSCYEKEKR
jgi:hypothetical protein